ncbi:formate dehydrogenase beta subunit [Acidihalobacter ferrooxydans]|uniref:NADH-quinone oxidoreductase subunit F n=1 Tax=Acidihalobacter ferrooxydans TaxID=1765967 RepID=A0A1P8UGX5_9GAMM|nr:formate dehydrogenase beta subunit [Acidihalobacter ferrooxydans]APZ43097.1 formate dehydrogenase [Acidihalobacter ferrooxydans]
MKVYMSADSSSQAIGTREIAEALTASAAQRALELTLVRTGSRGLYWLEPMLEVERDGRREAFGPLTPADVPGVLDALAAGHAHPRALGPVEALPEEQGQQRVNFRRCGVVAPGDWRDYLATGGMLGLRRALELGADGVVAAVTASGLRGRGGAGFPTGVKWRTTRAAAADTKFIVCNADEGDSGTFADRMLMEGDPLSLIEGMVIAGYAVGAAQGFIYLRSEYPLAREVLERAIETAYANGLLGADALGSGARFDVHLRLGAGAYICGEETSLLESLEGKRGTVRYKPPLPAMEGLFGKPTVVNNVITLATVPAILTDGAEAYAALGHGRSRGTLTLQLCGNVRRPGLYELPFGVTLGHVVQTLGGGSASGRPVRAVQVGGPLGAYFPVELFDTPLDYEAFAARGGMLGHGGVVVFDDTVDMLEQARFAMEFCALESCGKCTPCRIGSTRGAELIERMRGGARAQQLTLLEDLCEVMEQGSLCALGGLTPVPVRSAFKHFPEDFQPAAVAAAG